jgi:nucleoside-diphosphate-sugar epimerase
MKILLLGGTGNLSADCGAVLHTHGHEIHVVTRGLTEVPAGYHAHRADRRDAAGMRAALAGLAPDVVINFIGFDVPDVEVDHSLFKGNTGQYVFISSATVYAKPSARLPITEDAPLGNFLWDYARKKLACERWLLERRAEDGFPVTIVRPSHTYSRRWIPNVVSSGSYNFAARLEQGRPVFVPDDGENPWTLTAVSDFAAGLAGVVGNPRSIGEAFHVTSDEVLTWNQIFAEIADALDVRAPKIEKIPTDLICQAAPPLAGTLKGDKAHPGVFDNSKLKRFVPGFQCRKKFREGIRESVAWLRAHPEERRFDPAVEAQFEAVLAAWARRIQNEP